LYVIVLLSIKILPEQKCTHFSETCYYASFHDPTVSVAIVPVLSPSPRPENSRVRHVVITDCRKWKIQKLKRRDTQRAWWAYQTTFFFPF